MTLKIFSFLVPTTVGRIVIWWNHFNTDNLNCALMGPILSPVLTHLTCRLAFFSNNETGSGVTNYPNCRWKNIYRKITNSHTHKKIKLRLKYNITVFIIMFESYNKSCVSKSRVWQVLHLIIICHCQCCLFVHNFK